MKRTSVLGKGRASIVIVLVAVMTFGGRPGFSESAQSLEPLVETDEAEAACGISACLLSANFFSGDDPLASAIRDARNNARIIKDDVRDIDTDVEFIASFQDSRAIILRAIERSVDEALPLVMDIAADIITHHNIMLGLLAAHEDTILAELASHNGRLLQHDQRLADGQDQLNGKLAEIQDSLIDLAAAGGGTATPTLATPVCQNDRGLLDATRQKLIVAICDFQALAETDSLGSAHDKLTDGDTELGILTTPDLVSLCPPGDPVALPCTNIPGSYLEASDRYLQGLQVLSSCPRVPFGCQ